MKINKMELIQRIVNLNPNKTELTFNELNDLLNEYDLEVEMEGTNGIKKEEEEINNSSSSFTELRIFSRPEPKASPNAEDSLKNSKMFDENIVKNFKSFVSADDPNLPKFARVVLGMKQFSKRKNVTKVYPRGLEDIGLNSIKSVMSESKCDPDYAIALTSHGQLYPRFLAIHPEVLKTQREKMLLGRLLDKPILIKYIPKVIEDCGEIPYLENMKDILKGAGVWEIKESLSQSYVSSLVEFVRKIVSIERFEEFLYDQVFSHIIGFTKDEHSSYYIGHWNSACAKNYRLLEDKYCRDFIEDLTHLKEFEDAVYDKVITYGNPYNAFNNSNTATLEKKLRRVSRRCIKLIESLDSDYTPNRSTSPKYSEDSVREICYNILNVPIKKAYAKGTHIPKYLFDLYNSPNGYKDLDLGDFYRAIFELVE